jgi:DNA-binding CsgD family transcriptional regulator
VDKDVLAAFIAQGRSLEWIGRRLGRHPSTVAYWLDKHGLAPAHRERHAARGAPDAMALRQLVSDGLTIREIAARIGRSPATARYWLQFHGLRTARSVAGPRSAGEGGAALCERHGLTRHVRRGGRLRCCRCNSDAVSARRRTVKRLLVAEAGGGCVICGYDAYVGALQFHHVDPAQKRFHLGLKGLARALDTVREEAKKCVLLCANCHAEVEGGVAEVPSSAMHRIRG